LKDVRLRSLVVATDVLHEAAVSIFRAEGASTSLETKYSMNWTLNRMAKLNTTRILH
jgi:hypothetical protein